MLISILLTQSSLRLKISPVMLDIDVVLPLAS